MIKTSLTIMLFYLNLMVDTQGIINQKTLGNLSNGIPKLYSEVFQTEKRPSFEAFKMAYEGFDKLKRKGLVENQNYISIVDFSISSGRKRYWLVDIANKQVLFNTYVAHGKNTGVENAKRFSNKKNSNMSSIGFYLTEETYIGKHGYSLRLDGLEKGFNSNARDRAIVVHEADYVSEKFIEANGRLGRSFGCPALPKEYNIAIINLIKGKSVFFVYYPSQDYFKKSEVLNDSESQSQSFNLGSNSTALF